MLTAKLRAIPRCIASTCRIAKPTVAALTTCATLLLAGQASAQTKNVMVHLFEWKWTDIENECAYLSEKGYGAVQVSPPNEHARKDGEPWWQRYQPVSYQLNSRGGTEAQFSSMVETCWKDHGVKIVVDAVINHMAGGSGVGYFGTPFSGSNDYFLYEKNGQEFRYNSQDFHPFCSINWSQEFVPADEIRRCEAVGGLPDLATEDDGNGNRVKTRITDFLNSMIDLGVTGFRFDAAKHMHPADIKDIVDNLHDLRSDSGWFSTGERPTVFQEVIGGSGQGSTPEQYMLTSQGQRLNVTEFNYGLKVGGKFRNDGGTIDDLINDGFPVATSGWDLIDSAHALVFTDNHDNQRGHGSGYFDPNTGNIGGIVTHFYDGSVYNLANVFMLAWPYGSPKVMSSYDWDRNLGWDNGRFKDLNDGAGPPSASNGNTNDVSCGNGWICEHRWGSIAGMVGFNNFTQDAWNVGHTWAPQGQNKIAFARVKPNGSSSGFVVINRDGASVNQSFQTGLPSGNYCDVAQGSYNFDTAVCEGPTINVDSNGMADFNVSGMSASAIHVGAFACVGDCTTNDNVYFRGTPNDWTTSDMTLVNGLWEITVTFGTDNPRFKICEDLTWDNCNPAQDQLITQGAGEYTITFDTNTDAISVVKNDGPPPGNVDVTFTCQLGNTTSGTSVYVVGNRPELGPWGINSTAQKLDPSNYPTWSGTISLPANTVYEWKCVKALESDFTITQWAGGDNNKFSTANSTSASGSF